MVDKPDTALTNVAKPSSPVCSVFIRPGCAGEGSVALAQPFSLDNVGAVLEHTRFCRRRVIDCTHTHKPEHTHTHNIDDGM